MDTNGNTTKKDSAESRRNAFLALGKKIAELQDYVKPRNNVHHEIKRLTASIRKLFDNFADVVEEQRPAGRPETTAAYTQTSSDQSSTGGGGAKPTTIAAGTQTTPGLQTHHGQDAADRKKEPQFAVPPEATTTAATANGEPIAQMDWQVAAKRRQKLSKPRPARPDLIIVKAKEGGPSYADILRDMKSDPSLKAVGESVTKVRRNAAGNLLLELKKSAAATQVSDALSLKLGESASVVMRIDETTLEIRDLDELTAANDVRAALGESLEVTTIEEAAIKSIRKAYGSTQTAVVRLPTELARKALEKGRVRIGWVNCRVREKTEVRKCYRCWAFGHLARNCKGTDRSNCCLRCSEPGHTRAACRSAEARCVLCSDNRGNHPTGSFGCPAYQVAMKAVTGRT